MPKKSKPQPRRQSVGTLAAQAASHLQAGRFRQASDLYKQLLKREQRAEWRDALAQAYRGRARQLTAKGLYIEATALWENMEALCGQRYPEEGIDLLLEAGSLDKAARRFAAAGPAFCDSPGGTRLAARLAGLLACGHEEIAAALPADSPLLRHRDAVLAAMDACCRGDDAAMKECLKAIPFRSPYRDLRLILQGLAAFTTDPQDAGAQIDRVAADSPFARFAALVRTAGLDNAALLPALADLQPQEREMVLALKGWDARRRDFASRLAEIGRADARALLRFALRHGEGLEASRLRPFCLQLLPHDPDSLPAFEKRFGALPPLERERIQALAAEQRREPLIARDHWQVCVEQLTATSKDDNALAAALILRRMADLTVQARGLGPWSKEVPLFLARSVELDPQDKSTYLQLIQIAHQQDDAKEQDFWIQRAVRQFPEDAEVLMMAGASAYRRGAFKKAAGFAQTLLARDPINPHARALLISCHLAHARKQMRAGRHAPAGQELSAAAQVAREAEQHGIVELHRGFLALLQGAEQEAEARLRQGLRDLGGGLVAQFRFLVDGQRLDIAQRTLTRHYNRVRGEPAPPTVQEITRLAEYIHRYLDDKVKAIPKILEHLRAPLRAAARLGFTEQETRAVLKALARAGDYPLLRDYAEAAMQRFGQQPRLLYYYVAGRTQGRENRATTLERVQLQAALDRALAAEDPETAALIEEYLGLPLFPAGALPPMPPKVREAFEELMELLDTDNPQDILDTLSEHLQDEDELPPLPSPFPRRRRK
ncbi:MAG: hypothetical protein M3Z21_10865 [Pseudomonadota bacterium]|nr:hypothetical protein [Pseudomonadota bacterium]